jgi:hypothetical protein
VTWHVHEVSWWQRRNLSASASVTAAGAVALFGRSGLASGFRTSSGSRLHWALVGQQLGCTRKETSWGAGPWIGAEDGPAGGIGPKPILIQIIPFYFAIFS